MNLKKPGTLGRGLSFLFENEENKAKLAQRSVEISNISHPKVTDNAEYRQIEMSRIRPSTNQPRKSFEDAQIEELAQSIKENGLLQAILVRQAGIDTYEIVAGERRFRACKIAGLKQIPCIIKTMADIEMLQASIVENIQRVQMSPVEEAGAYRRLAQEFRLSHDEIARKVCKSRSHVSNILRLHSLPMEVLSMVDKGQISFGHAKVLLSLSPELISFYAQKILHKDLSVAALSKMLQAPQPTLTLLSTENPKQSRARIDKAQLPQDPDLLGIKEIVEKKLGMDVAIDSRSISIHYANADQLDWLISALMNIKPSEISSDEDRHEKERLSQHCVR